MICILLTTAFIAILSFYFGVNIRTEKKNMVYFSHSDNTIAYLTAKFKIKRYETYQVCCLIALLALFGLAIFL